MSETLFSWAELEDVCNGRWLNPSKADGGITAVSTDSRTITPGDLYLALVGDHFDGHDFADSVAEKGAAAVIASKPVDTGLPTLLVADTLVAYQALAAHHRRRFPELVIVGITGSSGKTSSKEILAAVAEKRFGTDAVLVTRGNTNNHIGVPRNLLRLTADHACAILEMGTNAPGEIALLRSLVEPQISVLTNVGPVHLEGLGSLEGVAREKGDVFIGAQLGVLPKAFADNPIIAEKLPNAVVRTGFAPECDIALGAIDNHLLGSRFSVRMGYEHATVDWGLTGDHMAMNAAAGFALGARLGMSMDEVAEALKVCRNEAMRMQVIERDGHTFVNDAYNANPDSMKALINWLAEVVEDKRRLTVVLGDMLELGDGELDLHRGVMEHAATTLVGSRIVGFGPRTAKAVGSDFESFQEMDELRSAVLNCPTGSTIAFKGSRGMGLERILADA